MIEDSDMNVLTIDIGGSNVKLLATGREEPRKFKSGPDLTPGRMVEQVRERVGDWDFEAISIGYPGRTGVDGPLDEPGNLGDGWVGFDYAGALGRPVKFINDAAMQALGDYRGGRMLFLGLGTGLGSALVAEQAVITLELGRLRQGHKRSLGERLGKKGRKRLGEERWRTLVLEVSAELKEAFRADEVALGGGGIKLIDDPPEGIRTTAGKAAFLGGFRLWEMEEVPPVAEDGQLLAPIPSRHVWRLV